MIWTAWTNGKSGFGMKISIADRDRYFKREWGEIELELPKDGGFIRCAINIDKDSFWNYTCRELIKKEIGDWLEANKYYPWDDGNPPKFEAKHIKDNVFRIVGKV